MKYRVKGKKIIERRNFKRLELTKDITLALGKGAILLSLLLVPNAGRMLEIFGDNFTPKKGKYDRKERIKRAVARLKKKRDVEIYEKGENTFVQLTQAGKKRLLVYQLEKLEIKKPKRWDGNWRFIFFDIPETKRPARDALVNKLRELGFMNLQKSVWVFPYPCKDEIDFISEIFNIGHYVNYIETRYVDDEEKLKLYFFKDAL